MSANNIIIIFAIVALVSLVGYIAYLQENPDITLNTAIKGYNPVIEHDTPLTIPTEPMNNSNDSLTGSIFNFAFEIPILGKIFGFIAWVINTSVYILDLLWSYLSLITGLFSILPPIMSLVIIFMFVWMLTLIYQTYMPGKM
jgi:hypothetical protein